MSNIQPANILRFDVATLVTIRHILAERNLTAAAHLAGITQPAASNTLARVRKVLADPLLVRGRSGLSLTARGELLLSQLDEVVPLLEAMAKPPEFDPATSSTMFNIAASDHASLLLMPRVLRKVRDMAPSVRISVSLIQGGQARGVDLEKSGFDLRLGWLQTLPPYWFSRRLLDDSIGVICSAHSGLTAETFTAEVFQSRGHVALATEKPLYQTLADQALARLGIQRNVVAWTTNFTAIPLMVAGSDLIALFPLTLARLYQGFAGIRAFPSPVPLGEYHITMAWHPRVKDDPAHQWLRSVIIEAATGE
jgi:DNA-binding transcriptional LysR family regulator